MDNHIEKQIIKHEYGYSRERYNYSLPLLKHEQFIEIASDINWGVVIENSPNTYQLYLQYLNPVVFLTRAYITLIMIEDKDYLMKTYVKNKLGVVDSAIIAKINNVDGNYIDVSDNNILEYQLLNQGSIQ